MTSIGTEPLFYAGDVSICPDGALLKGSVYIKAGSVLRQMVSLGIGSGDYHAWGILFGGIADVDWTQYENYGVAEGIDFAMLYGGYIDPAIAGLTAYFDTASVKQVLTPSITGCLLYTSPSPRD